MDSARDHAPNTSAATPKSAAPTGQMTLVGQVVLPAKRANPKRAIRGGKRLIEIWKVHGDNTFQIMVRTGRHPPTGIRLFADSLAALAAVVETGAADGWRRYYSIGPQVPGDKSREDHK